MVHVGDINLLGENTNAIKRNTSDLLIANKEVGVIVNYDKTKCMFMSVNSLKEKFTI